MKYQEENDRRDGAVACEPALRGQNQSHHLWWWWSSTSGVYGMPSSFSSGQNSERRRSCWRGLVCQGVKRRISVALPLDPGVAEVAAPGFGGFDPKPQPARVAPHDAEVVVAVHLEEDLPVFACGAQLPGARVAFFLEAVELGVADAAGDQVEAPPRRASAGRR